MRLARNARVIAYEQGFLSEVLDVMERYSEPEQTLVTFEPSGLLEVLEEHCPVTVADGNTPEVIDGGSVANSALSVHDGPPRRSSRDEGGPE